MRVHGGALITVLLVVAKWSNDQESIYSPGRVKLKKLGDQVLRGRKPIQLFE